VFFITFLSFVDVVEIFKTRLPYSPIDFSQLVYCYNFVSVFAPLVSARARKLPLGIKLSFIIRPLIDLVSIALPISSLIFNVFSHLHPASFYIPLTSTAAGQYGLGVAPTSLQEGPAQTPRVTQHLPIVTIW